MVPVLPRSFMRPGRFYLRKSSGSLAELAALPEVLPLSHALGDVLDQVLDGRDVAAFAVLAAGSRPLSMIERNSVALIRAALSDHRGERRILMKRWWSWMR
jgi:hypothetical protein